MSKRGKPVAVLTLALGVLVVTSGLLVRDRLREEWYLFRLGSDGPETRLTAANQLARLGSLRAIPRLVRLIEREDREQANVYAAASAREEGAVTLTPLAYALYRIGPAGRARLEQATQGLRQSATVVRLFLPLIAEDKSLQASSLSFTVRTSPRICEVILYCWRSSETPVRRADYDTS